MISRQIDVSDLELLQHARNGSSDSFGLLLERFRPRLYATALTILKDIYRADDAVQDAFVLAITRFQSLREPAAFTGWLFAILRNVCFGYLRGNSKEILAADHDKLNKDDDGFADEVSLEEMVEHHFLRADILSALSHLSEPLRATIMLRYMSSASSYEDIATILGVPLGTVRSRLAQARNDLLGHFLHRRGITNENTLTIERREQYLYWLGRLYRGDRDWYFARYAQNLCYIAQGQAMTLAVLVEEVEGDVAVGSVLHPFHFMASGNLTIIEARIHSPADDPFRCPPFGVEMLVHQGDKIVRVHRYLSPHLPVE